MPSYSSRNITPLLPGCVPACPACRHRGLSANESESAKLRWVQRQLALWRPCIRSIKGPASERRQGYRDRLSLRTEWTTDSWRFGVTLRDKLIPIPECPVHSKRARTVLRVLAAALPSVDRFPMTFYVQSGAQATLVLRTSIAPSLGWLTQPTGRALASTGLDGLWLNLNPSAGRRLFAKRGWRLIWGEPESRTELGLRHGPEAFQQVLADLHGLSLDEAEAFLNPGPGDAVLDLYCGHGATLARWLGRGATTLGIELGGEAVRYAGLNAPGATVLRGSCETRLPQLRAWAAQHAEPLVYLNPPRTGIEPKVLQWIVRGTRPSRIAYLSCSMASLARDLKVLCDAGYRVESIQPYDFFPQTDHVEALCLLSAE